MVHKKPLSLEAFADIKGVGETKLKKYGVTFISLIRSILTNS
ncbi:MAG: HRDC domain-containing protein [Tannerella sp.]|nr:HRDC domain-containing protein [Tannerella sp.]